ncbi:MAG: glycosyltransferase family 2 protein [Parcubacteria group bacterium]|nr:glycosyltransferase family 2 protein [Parcubacteria group bacterium]
MKLAVIIPAYNEQETIQSVIQKIPVKIKGLSHQEVIVVDDGSTDQTAQLAREAVALVVSHTKNRGVGVAFTTGVDVALRRGADLVVTCDADNQFDPSEIPKLLEPILAAQADVVLGSRFSPGSVLSGIPRVKLWGNKFMSWFLSWICKEKFSDVSCGFRAYSKEALLWTNLFGEFTYTHEAVLSLSFKNLRIKEVPITTLYFPERVSSVSGNLVAYGFRSLRIILQAILGYRPFKFFGTLGGLIFVIGVLLDLVMMIIFWQTSSFSPYRFIGISGLIFNIVGIAAFIVGLAAGLLNRVRQNQERILYFLKKRAYSDSSNHFSK